MILLASAGRSDEKLLLPGCNTKSFELLLYWMFKKELPDLTWAEEAASSGEEDEEEDTHDCQLSCGEPQVALVRLWHSAGIYAMPELQNAAMNRLLDLLFGCFVAQKAIQAAYDIGAPGCYLQDVLVQEFVLDYTDRPEDNHDETEMNNFARIPGFFSNFAAVMRKDVQARDRREARESASTDDRQRATCMVPVLQE